MPVLPEARRSKAIGVCHDAAVGVGNSYIKQGGRDIEADAAYDCAEVLLHIDNLDGLINSAMRLHGAEKFADRTAEIARIVAFKGIAAGREQRKEMGQ